jgi:YaiO family outer membrane protein
MNKSIFTCTSLLLACAAYAPVQAQTLTQAQLSPTKFNLSSEFTNYSKAFGSRRETSLESVTDFGNTTLILSGSQGKRKFADATYSAARLGRTIYHDWSDRFFTRTSIGASTNDPVFARREIAQDFNYKALSNTVVTVGGKYAKYFGGREARSLSAGGSYYFGGGFVSYKFSAYDVTGLGKSYGHQASFRLKDRTGDGATQLWAGAGSSLHDVEFLPTAVKGHYRSIALQRVQPIKGPIAINLGVGRNWYDTSAGRYHGTTATVGLAVRGWSKF